MYYEVRILMNGQRVRLKSREKTGDKEKYISLHQMLTSVLWCELLHGSRQTFIKLMLAWNQGLADRLLPESQHTAVAPHLVHKGLKHHPFLHAALRL